MYVIVRSFLLITDSYYSLFIRYDYRCVIYGWDEKCTMSEAWIAQMGVNQHPPGSNQPFYNVMSHDGSNRYASQGGAYIYSDTFCSLASQTYFEWTGQCTRKG